MFSTRCVWILDRCGTLPDATSPLNHPLGFNMSRRHTHEAIQRSYYLGMQYLALNYITLPHSYQLSEHTYFQHRFLITNG